MVWAQGQMKWAKVKYTTYDITHKKSETQNRQIFLSVWTAI